MSLSPTPEIADPPTCLELGKYKAWICLDGVAVPCYSVKTEMAYMERFIESVVGAKVSVHWQDNTEKPRELYGRVLSMDGRSVDSLTFYGNTLKKACPGTYKRIESIHGEYVAKDHRRLFQFNNSGEAEKVREHMPKPTLKGGAIELSYYSLRSSNSTGAPLTFSDANEKWKAPPFLQTKHPLNQLQHQLSAEIVQYCGDPVRHSCAWEYEKKEPFLTFKFNYLSEALLKLAGHLPNKPPPSATTPNFLSTAGTPHIPTSKSAAQRELVELGVQEINLKLLRNKRRQEGIIALIKAYEEEEE
ncbi:hypothetical protein MNV49_004862 [Pseudohyphozyma bogoriensis]|nr:hypothetical protein MNV49_004862 [Pseudohyphozyma bogoriensis]